MWGCSSTEVTVCLWWLRKIYWIKGWEWGEGMLIWQYGQQSSVLSINWLVLATRQTGLTSLWTCGHHRESTSLNHLGIKGCLVPNSNNNDINRSRKMLPGGKAICFLHRTFYCSIMNQDYWFSPRCQMSIPGNISDTCCLKEDACVLWT